MLRRIDLPVRFVSPQRQKGVVLMIALIMLVSLTLAGIALVRSVDTTTIIAGNLGFKQSATSSGDLGNEQAIAFLESYNSGTTLHAAIGGQGQYVPFVENPGAGQTWDTFWQNVIGANAKALVPATDAAGNSASYVIHRLCNSAGDPVSVADCAISPASAANSGSSKGAGVVALNFSAAIYYRITTRVVGPRNTVSYIQTVIAL